MITPKITIQSKMLPTTGIIEDILVSTISTEITKMSKLAESSTLLRTENISQSTEQIKVDTTNSPTTEMLTKLSSSTEYPLVITHPNTLAINELKTSTTSSMTLEATTFVDTTFEATTFVATTFEATAIMSTVSTVDDFFSTSTVHEQFSNTVPATILKCCCVCCTSTYPATCKVCSDSTSSDTAVCAAKIPQPFKSGYVRGTSNFQAPEHLNGSNIAERLAYEKNFEMSELFTESFATMADNVKSSMGYGLMDLVLDCTYDGIQCALDRWVSALY